MNNGVFTTIYGWMWSVLGLRGFTKEVFAVIYGFSTRKKDTAISPYAVIQAITGASRSSISAALKELEARKLIECRRKKGRCTHYLVTIDEKYRKNMFTSSNPELPSPKTGSGSPASGHENKGRDEENISNNSITVQTAQKTFKKVPAVHKLNKGGNKK